MQKKYLLAAFIVFFSFLIYTFKMEHAVFYHPDLSRDLHDILKIIQGHPTLIGPKLTFGGLYTGPYYYYLFVPIFFISKFNILAVYFFNAFIFCLACGYFFLKAWGKYSLSKAILGTAAFSLLPIFLIGSRNPSNAYSFIPLLSGLLTYIYFEPPQKKLPLTILGFLTGIVVNFHFINIAITPSIFFVLFFFQKNKKNILWFFAGFFAAFLPLLLFEIKHDFIMFKNTFIQKSYLNWLNNKNIPGGISAKKNIIENIFFMSGQAATLTLINPLIAYTTIPFIFFRSKMPKKELLFYLGSILSFLIFCLIIRFQFIPHYLFATAFLLFFTACVILLNSRLWPLLIIFVLLEIAFFPKNLYQDSWRKPETFERAVNLAIQKKLIQKDSSFNVIQITKQNLLATLGFEYRFFLRKNGYIPDSEFAYNSSNILLIFSELPNLDINKFNSWEATEFGKKYFPKAQKYTIDNLTIYRIVK